MVIGYSKRKKKSGRKIKRKKKEHLLPHRCSVGALVSLL